MHTHFADEDIEIQRDGGRPKLCSQEEAGEDRTWFLALLVACTFPPLHVRWFSLCLASLLL